MFGVGGHKQISCEHLAGQEYQRVMLAVASHDGAYQAGGLSGWRGMTSAIHAILSVPFAAHLAQSWSVDPNAPENDESCRQEPIR
tara:strand:+ start:140825 stop:141079 length:255 start_codon:yes stop_codon:yes gene_type:complete